MSLSSDLISQFVKTTKDTTETKKDVTTYGTAVVEDDKIFVILDGSDIKTPVITTASVKNDERVMVTIKNHTAIITGNTTSPSTTVDYVNIATADKVNTEELSAEQARIELLIADNAVIKERLVASELDVDKLQAKDVQIDGRLEASEADIGSLKTSKLDAGVAKATYATINSLDAAYGDIKTLIFGSATGNVIQASFSNAVIAQLGDAQIKSAMIESVSAGKITAGDIITNNVRVMSEDGSLIISDETIKIKDGDQVRVQIGKDASGDYSITICDPNGDVMFHEGGITDAAIKKAIIRNDMVSDTANIHASKLNIDSLFEEINDSSNTIKSTKVYLDDEKQTLDVAFKSLTIEVGSQGQTISSQGTAISTIQGQISSKIWQQDINTAKNEMSTQYSTLEQEVDSISTTVANNTTAIGEKADSATVTTINNKVTSLEQNLDGFKTTVSETYATTSDLDNLEIGGRNLLLNTGGGGLVKFTNNAESISAGVRSYTNDKGHITLVASANTTEIYYRFMTPSNSNLYGLEPGETYMFSGKARSTTASGTLNQLVVRTQHTAGNGWTGGVSHVITMDDTDDWIPFTKTFTIPETALGYYVSLQLYYEGSWNGTIELKDLKIEKGDKATDWTPAPEDIEVEINALSTRVSSAESSITQLDDKITANVTETSNLGTRMTTVEQTASDLTVKLESVIIGGTNLLSDTKEKPQLNGAGSTSGQDKYLGFSVAYYDNSMSTSTKDVSGCSSFFTPEPNMEYTLSFYAKGSGTMRSFLYPSTVASGYSNEGKTTTSNDGMLTHTLTNDWKKYIIVWKTTSDTTGAKHILPMRLSAGAIGYICGVKFEKGNRATDWSPSPDEIASDILDAAKTATNYLNFSSSGLIVGDMTASTLGKNVLIDSDSVDIRTGTTTLASFGASTIYLGKNNDKSIINLCNGSATMTAVDDTDFRIYSDKRLVMSAYNSMLLDCYRDSTHMTRIAIQSSDPEQSSVVGGVQFTIYQDDIQNTVQMLGNDIILKVTDGTDTSRFTIQENAVKLYSSGRIYLNSASTLQIGESSSYSYSLVLGNTYGKAKSIGCYWNDGEAHDLITHAANGQNSFFGPSDISITESSSLTSTTNIRGKYIRLYNHEGGGVYLGSSGSTAVTSDRNLKKDIVDIDNKYLDFFDRLRPITYKYDCPENNGHRDHVGFIAQEVEEALTASGLTTEQFAGLVIERDVTLNPNYDSSLSDEENTANETHYDALYSLRYEEFISLLVKKVQSLQEQIDQLRAGI